MCGFLERLFQIGGYVRIIILTPRDTHHGRTSEKHTLKSSTYPNPWQIASASPSDDKDAVDAKVTPSRYFRWKPLIAKVTALALIVPGLPIMCILMLIVRISSRGPALYAQSRVGKDGVTFTMYKLRSMRIDAEDDSGPVWSSGDDPRVTPIGRFLRDRHLDELPQLFNVLRGEMDLFGPRPERPEFTCVLSEELPAYSDRTLVRPGITGLAQINLPPDSDLESVRRKLHLDFEYIRGATFWLDLRMFFATSLRLLGIPGDLVMEFTKLRREIKPKQVAYPVATGK